MTDETHETPDETEETAATDASATEATEPDATGSESGATEPAAIETAQPDDAAAQVTTKPSRDRSYVRVPMWAAAAIGAVVIAGGGFLLGRVTAPDDGRVEVRAAQFPSAQGLPDFRPTDPDETPRPVARAFFGVSVEAAANGVSVIRVSRGSPAEEAGVKDGDVITKVDGKDVTTRAELAEQIQSHEPGDEVTITYTRDGGTSEVKVRLDDRLAEVSPSN